MDAEEDNGRSTGNSCSGRSTRNGKTKRTGTSCTPSSVSLPSHGMTGLDRRASKSKTPEPKKTRRRQPQGQSSLQGNGGRHREASAPQDALPMARPRVRVQDIGPSDEYSYIPGLNDDLALLCLAYLPRSEHHNVMQINRKFCALITSGDLFKTRRRLGIAEQWIYMFSSGQQVWQAYDPRVLRWRSLPPFAADYCFHNSDKESFTVGTQLMVVGRHADDGLISWRFDLASNAWARGSMMLTPRCLYAWASCGRYAYVAGGLTLPGEVLQSTEVYDPDTETWKVLPPMHERRKLCSGCLLDGKFYVLGGENDESGALTSCEVFDPIAQTWTLLPNMLPWADSRSSPGAPPLSAVVNNELYVLEIESHQLKVFNKSTSTWRVLGKVPVRTDLVSGWGVAFKALGSYLLVIGGGRTPSYPDGMYVCKPDPNGSYLHWFLLSQLCPFGPFVLNCAIVSA